MGWWQRPTGGELICFEGVVLCRSLQALPVKLLLAENLSFSVRLRDTDRRLQLWRLQLLPFMDINLFGFGGKFPFWIGLVSWHPPKTPLKKSQLFLMTSSKQMYKLSREFPCVLFYSSGFARMMTWFNVIQMKFVCLFYGVCQVLEGQKDWHFEQEKLMTGKLKMDPWKEILILEVPCSFCIACIYHWKLNGQQQKQHSNLNLITYTHFYVDYWHQRFFMRRSLLLLFPLQIERLLGQILMLRSISHLGWVQSLLYKTLWLEKKLPEELSNEKKGPVLF